MSQNIWNPWHGCTKISEGCEHCYMYFLDKQRDKDGSVFHINKTNADMPLKKDRAGNYKIPSGSIIRVCMTSDFFLEEADPFRDHVWSIIRKRPDVIFYLLTKRADRIQKCLPDDWNNGYENVILNVTAENQVRADERIPILLSTPAKHKGICIAPFIGPISIKKYLISGDIERVSMGGENYDGARPLYDEWVSAVFEECKAHDVRCYLYETGTVYVKDGITYHNPQKAIQTESAFYSPYRFDGKTPVFKLYHPETGMLLTEKERKKALFTTTCLKCPESRYCTGCTGCKGCGRYDGLYEIPDGGKYSFILETK